MLFLPWLVIIAIGLFIYRWHQLASNSRPRIRGDVLLVFAHPDDEAMFFTPLLHYLKVNRISTHLLCLSNGGFDGKGAVREKELLASGAHYGVSPKNISCVNRAELKDGMKEVWPPTLVKAEIARYMNRVGSILTVVTFDRHGISQHPNHIAVSKGALELKQSMPPGLSFLQLKTRAVVLKYTSVFSMLGYFIGGNSCTSRNRFAIVIPPLSVLCSWRAMQMHASQLVWFRYLFLVFSSYTFMDEFSELNEDG